MSKGPSLKVRIILYPLLLIVFAFVSYVITLLARGYNVRFENWELIKEKTGTIIVATRPGDADIYVDNILQPSRTPNLNFMSIQIKRLSPGEHTLRLEKEGYETWEGVFMVEPGLVSWANLILLLPKERTPEPFNLPLNANNLIVSSDQKHLLVGTIDELNRVVSYWNVETQSKQKRKILEKELKENETFTPLFYSDNGQRILFEQTIAEVKNVYVYENRENAGSWNIAEIFRLPFDYYVFNPKSSDELYAFRGNDVYRLDYSSKTLSAVLEENVISGFVTGGQFHFIKKDPLKNLNSLYKYNGSGNKILVINKLPESDSYSIRYLGSKEGYSVLAKKSGYLYHYQGPVDPYAKTGKLVSENVSATIPSPKGQYVGYWQGRDFMVYEVDKERVYPVLRDEENVKISWFSDQFNLVYFRENTVNMVTVGAFYNKKIFESSFETFGTVSFDGSRVFFISQDKAKDTKDLFVFDYN